MDFVNKNPTVSQISIYEVATEKAFFLFLNVALVT